MEIHENPWKSMKIHGIYNHELFTSFQVLVVLNQP